MNAPTIQGVATKPLKWYEDERGRLLEILRCDDALFKGFGQVYVTTCRPGYVKAWHAHRQQDDSLVCLAGRVRVGLYDARPESPTHGATAEFFLSPENPMVLQIPRGVYHGFEAVGEQEAWVMNVPNRPYCRDAPDEVRVDPFHNDIPFAWRATRGG